MAQQFNAIIATQTVPVRGTSAISIPGTVTALAPFRAIRSAVYSVNLAGGQSGTFSCHVLGSIGGSTYIVAGFTGLAAAAGDYVLFPASYSADGTMDALETTFTGAKMSITNLVPPSVCVVEGGVATHGISSTVTFSACIRGD